MSNTHHLVFRHYLGNIQQTGIIKPGLIPGPGNLVDIMDAVFLIYFSTLYLNDDSWLMSKPKDLILFHTFGKITFH